MKNFLIIITMLLFITSCSSNKTSTLEGGIVESVPVVNVETEVNQEIEVNS
jgi:uncharacterized protein YcfL